MKYFLTPLLLLFSQLAFAQTPTYNEDVSCILYEHCTTCHHTGGIAPFSLMDYDDASAAAFGILGAVNAGTMPPWPPNPSYNQLAHERTLTQEEIDLITDWVNGGATEGAGTPPQPPVYLNEESITSPDLVVTMPSYTINTNGNDVYRCFVIPTSLNQDVYLTELEVVPGNFEAVHHVLLFQDETNVPAQLDAQDPGVGYTSFGGTGSSESTLIGGWVPGQGHKIYPNGMGVRLPAGTNIVMQVHYPATSNGQTDQTKVNLKYTTSIAREVYIDAPLHHFDLNEGALSIPPNQVRTFTCDYEVPNIVDVTLLDVSPHMHLLGKSISSWAVTPTNQTIPLIEIEDWDFHWQGFYDFRNPVRIPAGSTLFSSATYDNTSANPNNPNDPPQHVSAGEATTEEMMLVFFSYVIYQSGDENIVIDNSTHESHGCEAQVVDIQQTDSPEIKVYPNPASDFIQISGVTDMRSLTVTNALGKEVLRINQPKQLVDVSSLPNGVYIVTARTETESFSKTISILLSRPRIG